MYGAPFSSVPTSKTRATCGAEQLNPGATTLARKRTNASRCVIIAGRKNFTATRESRSSW